MIKKQLIYVLIVICLVVAVVSSSCKTKTGKTCKFPFKYNGVTYRDCTTIDNGSTKWCATSVSETGVLKDYGDCAGDCSVVNKPDSIGGCPTTNGRRCVFPFKYNEVTYNECTKEGFGDTFWCATTVSSNGDTIAYGICTANCPKPSTLSSEVCGTINGKACVFPFVYGEVSYKACTSVDNNDVPWCATSTNPSNHQYISYGNCKQSCKASTIDVISISQSSVSNSPVKPAIDTTIKPSKIDTTTVQPSKVDTTTVKPSKIDTTTVKPSRIDTTTMEPQTSAPAQSINLKKPKRVSLKGSNNVGGKRRGKGSNNGR
ncbi:matrix metalloproteinase-9 isoform X2 [Lepeophtheirus salmonis]|uniref:matrix metalloproteinase-9 isoform X2 n=1 Tax=Lepeophtheirus salmonis TaxID=72036 RepID=UPI001AE60D41|nr:matrix metalloproteinase-9-like isoform X2 [Lepeophtheirus salmonis]